MLLNGVHLLPDLSGALVYPKERLVAVSDPIGDPAARQAPQLAAEALKRLGAVLRQRRPATVVWLGTALPHLLADGRLAKRDCDELARLTQAHAWHWLGDGLPTGLPGHAAADLKAGSLSFRNTALPGTTVLGEVSAQGWPVATIDGRTWPCFVFDGRRMVMPAFGGRSDGLNVLGPGFQQLFRRPFQALMLAGGRILTRPRARLEAPPPPPAPIL
jgi:metallophosphoesterase superfamily enzyme